MTVRQDIAGVATDALLFTFALTYNKLPLNLSAWTVSVVVKSSQTASDGSGTTYTVGNGLTMVSAVSGRFTLSIPASGTPGALWYRAYVSAEGVGPYSAMCGVLTLMSA